MRIEHDPDSGCEGCPLLRQWGEPDEPTRWCMGGECDASPLGESAPAWCPLRSDDVTVTARRDRPEVEVGNERGVR